MQPGTDLITAAAKLTAGVQDGHDYFKRRKAGALVMLLYGDTASIVFYSYGTVGVDYNFDRVGIACHHFVGAIVDNFINQVMQAGLVGSANIHARTYTYRLKAFGDLEILLTVIPVALPVAIPTFMFGGCD